jgi:aminoglycoside phosphotransferase (APT) family kinase protein
MSDVTPGPVLENNRFDETRLADYLHGKVAGFEGAFEVRQFQGGQSNPTYRIATAADNYVLRKRPAGNLLPSAHLIEREFAVMRALEDVIPVPKVFHLCEDESVIGQSFYVMEHLDGRIMADARLLDAEPAERRALNLELVTVLARLHRADYRALGLEGFGRPTGYVARQLARWSKQYAAARIEENTTMDRLIPWLEEHLPTEDETAIVHGDYRSYNVIFAKSGPHILAVLDWELATIGHPLADLAYFCLPYYLPADDLRGFRGASPTDLAIPSEEEMRAAYCREVGRSDLPHWKYFLVFSLFRSAAIRAGVFKRAHDGTAADSQALEAGVRYRGAAACAWQLAQSVP